MTGSEQQSGVAAGSPAAENLGAKLRSARLAQDLTIEQIATELRIEARQLTALEENRLEQIGVPVFVKGYLRQYGQRLGLDYANLLALYQKQTSLAEVQIQPSRTIKLRDDRQVTAWFLAGIVLVALVVGLAVWWWNDGAFRLDLMSPTGLTSSIAPVEPPPVTATPVVAPAPAVAPPPPPEPLALPAAAPVTPAPLPAEPPPVEPAAASEPVAVSEPVATSRESGPLTIPLVLTFAGDSWSEITDARGERLFYGLGAAGQTAAVRGEPPFAVIIGNADAVQLLVAGEPYPIPTAGRQGNIARFAVDIAEE